MLDFPFEVILLTFINFCRYLEPAPGAFSDFNGAIDALSDL
jgi:hypothetical protein